MKSAIAKKALETAQNDLKHEKNKKKVENSILLTQKEKDEFNILCKVLGMGHFSCINFATKYFSYLMQNTIHPPCLPREQKITSRNPAIEIEYNLSPEVRSHIKEMSKKISEDKMVKLSILYFIKKILPHKKWRK